MSACSHKSKLSLLSFLFGLWFLRRQLRFSPPWSSPAWTLRYYTLSLPFHFSAFHPFFTAGNLLVTATYGDTLNPVVCRGFLVPELGEFGFWSGIGLELESLCHSSLFSAVADSNLQLQKIWIFRFFGGVYSGNSELLSGSFELWVWILSNLWAFSLYLKRNSWKKSLFLCWVSLSWWSYIVKCFGTWLIVGCVLQ